jgi:hypothetical protein
MLTKASRLDKGGEAMGTGFSLNLEALALFHLSCHPFLHVKITSLCA